MAGAFSGNRSNRAPRISTASLFPSRGKAFLHSAATSDLVRYSRESSFSRLGETPPYPASGQHLRQPVEEPDPKLDRRCFIVRDHNGQALPASTSRRSRDGARRRICSPATKPAGCQHRQAPGVAARAAADKRGVTSCSRTMSALCRFQLRTYRCNAADDATVKSRMGAVAWAIWQRSVSHSRSSNRTCRSPASGSPTGFTVGHTASTNRTRLQHGKSVSFAPRYSSLGRRLSLMVLTCPRIFGPSIS